MKTTIAVSAMEALIIKACGARSMTEFAKACGISPMHISRIKSGTCKPSKKMCIKLGNEPYVRQIGLSTEDFMKAAGYEINTEIKSTQDFEKVVANSLDTIALGLISKKIMSNGSAFQMIPLTDGSDVDFAFEILECGKIIRVYVCMMAQKQAAYGSNDRFIFFYSIGRLLTLKPDDNSQYVMIVSDEAVFDELKNCSEMAAVRANVILVLLDPEQMVFTKEVHLGPGKEYISLQD